MAGDFSGLNRGAMRQDLREQITQLGLDYRLMTQFTSFVAVEETTVTGEGGVPRRVEVPVEMPEGMSYEGVFGSRGEAVFAPAAMQYRTFDGGVVGGIIARPRLSMPKAMPRSSAAPACRGRTRSETQVARSTACPDSQPCPGLAGAFC